MSDQPVESQEKKKAPAKKRPKINVTRGKRKEAVARAFVRPGTGKIYYNGLLLEAYASPFLIEVVSEPLQFVSNPAFDFHVTTSGGGFSGQAQAARTAVARALVAQAKDDKLKQEFLDYDRSLLVEDPRRVEPKKFKGPKARARFTKSYR